MARRKKEHTQLPEHLRPKGGQGNRLTLTEQTAVYQAFLAIGNKAEVARQFGISQATVKRTIRAIERTTEKTDLKAAKEAMAVQLMGRFHESTNMILDSITAEDVESGRLPIYEHDKNGDIKIGPDGKPLIVGYKYFGPTLTQKAIAAGVFTDKIKVLRDFERAIGVDEQSGGLMIPESRDQLLSAIRGRIKSITALNVTFAEDHPDLATKISDLGIAEADAEEVTVEPGEYVDLRNPD